MPQNKLNENVLYTTKTNQNTSSHGNSQRYYPHYSNNERDLYNDDAYINDNDDIYYEDEEDEDVYNGYNDYNEDSVYDEYEEY